MSRFGKLNAGSGPQRTRDFLNLELGTWNLELGRFEAERRRRGSISEFRFQSSEFQVQPAAGVSRCTKAARPGEAVAISKDPGA